MKGLWGFEAGVLPITVLQKAPALRLQVVPVVRVRAQKP